MDCAVCPLAYNLAAQVPWQERQPGIFIREEGLSLLAELNGELGDAIAHREREIRLMERLHREAKSPRYADSTRAYMLRDRDGGVLQERRAILEALKKDKTRQHGQLIRRSQ